MAKDDSLDPLEKKKSRRKMNVAKPNVCVVVLLYVRAYMGSSVFLDVRLMSSAG